MMFRAMVRVEIMSILLLLICGQFMGFPTMSAASSKDHKLLLVLVDGFRWDYMETFFVPGELPGLTYLKVNGIHVQKLKPEFPTLTYLDLYSLMTGLHPETHGMIGNYIYDRDSGTQFLMGKNPIQYESYWWDDGEPLWVTAQKQGRRGYWWYWPGCEVEIRGHRPAFYQSYQSSPNPSFEKFAFALREAVEVLRNGSADVAGVYFEQVDHWGHRQGPSVSNQELKKTIQALDDELVKVIDLLRTTNFENNERPLSSGINLMLFSDHGMAKLVDHDAVISYKDLAVDESTLIVGSHLVPVLKIYTRNSTTTKSMYDYFRKLHPKLRVYRKHEIPDRYFYKRHRRVPELLLVADEGYVIAQQDYFGNSTATGFHGYDNEVPDMQGILFAMGPDFKKNERVASLRGIDLYQVMCHLLEITASPNNGTWSDVCPLLEDSSMCPSSDNPFFGLASLIICFTVVVISCKFLSGISAFRWRSVRFKKLIG